MSVHDASYASAELRSARAALRRRVVQGWNLGDILADVDSYPEIHSALIGQLVRWIPLVGERRAERLTRGFPVMRVDELTPPQHALLLIRVRTYERRRA